MKGFWRRLRVPISCTVLTAIFQLIGVGIDYLFDVWALQITLIFWSLSAVPIAASLYWLRRMHRIYYGAFEFLVAFGVLYFIMINMIYRNAGREITLQLITSRTLTIFAVIYFMVRAMDNIGEGLTPGSVADTRWKVIFPKAGP